MTEEFTVLQHIVVISSLAVAVLSVVTLAVFYFRFRSLRDELIASLNALVDQPTTYDQQAVRSMLCRTGDCLLQDSASGAENSKDRCCTAK